MSADATVIIVNYNVRDMLIDCLESILVSPSASRLHIIVIDNDSGDGSVEAITERFGDRIETMQSGENVGFAKANNIAAQGVTTDWILLLNPDTVVHEDAIGKLLRFAEAHPEAGIYGGRTTYADGSINPSSCWMRPTPWSMICQTLGLTSFRRARMLNPEQPDVWRVGRPEHVDIVSGAFFLITRRLWEDLGGFDERFFMYGEEADLCMRAEEHGARPMVTEDSVVTHHGGASERSRAEKLIRLLAAKRRLAQAHWKNGWLAKPMSAAWPLSRVIAGGLMGFSNSRTRERSRVWRRVWARRNEWLTDE